MRDVLELDARVLERPQRGHQPLAAGLDAHTDAAGRARRSASRRGRAAASSSATRARSPSWRTWSSTMLPPIWRLSSAGLPGRHRAAVVDDHDLAGEVVGLVEVLGRQQHVGPGLHERADRIPQLDPAARVKTGGRLVEQQQPRRPDEARAEVEPAAHAARVRAREPVGVLDQPELLEHGAGARLRGRGGSVRTGGRPSRGSRARSSPARSPRTARRARSPAAPRPDPWRRRGRRRSSVPESARSSVATVRTNVVLPAPFGPSTATTCPASAVRSRPSRATVLPKRFVRPRASIVAVI